MPKVKSNSNRIRRFRTPNSALLTKYEKIALLSAVYSQSTIVSKLQCSYGTISSAIEFFSSKKLSEYQNEWTLMVNKEFQTIIGLSGFKNKHPNFEIENIEEFNQFLANNLSENQNREFYFRLQFYEYVFPDLSIIGIDDLTAIFHALIGEKGFNAQIRSRYEDKVRLTPQNGRIFITPKEVFQTPESHQNEKPKVIATKDNLILL